MGRDYLEKLIKVYVRQGRLKDAYDHLIFKGLNESQSKKYIENIQKIVGNEPND